MERSPTRRWLIQDWGLFSHSFIPSFVISHREAPQREQPVKPNGLRSPPKDGRQNFERFTFSSRLRFVFSNSRSACLIPGNCDFS